jgi:transposase
MPGPLVSDELWELVEPLIPKVPRRHRFPGRKRIDDRKVLTGILFVLQTGIPWEYLPQEMGCGSGVTCWRRLRERQEAGVWRRLHELLLAKLNEADRIDWNRAAMTARTCERLGGRKDRPSPVDRSRSGSKHHLITCGRGTPLACLLTGGNRNDISQLVPLVDAIPPVRGRRGRPRQRPRSLYGDRAYHSRGGRGELRRRHIQAKIAWPKSAHGSGLGTKRWVVERTIAWLHQYRRVRIRYEHRDDIHEAFLAIGCSLICLKLLHAEGSLPDTEVGNALSLMRRGRSEREVSGDQRRWREPNETDARVGERAVQEPLVP